jgi:hypothetical protein
MEKNNLINSMPDFDSNNKMRAELDKLEKEKHSISTRIQQIKDALRTNSEEYTKKYVKMFHPGSTWAIDGEYHEYFKVKKCIMENYDCCEENIDDYTIVIIGSYLRLPNPVTKYRAYAQFLQNETVYIRIKEISHVREITHDEWNQALHELVLLEKF